MMIHIDTRMQTHTLSGKECVLALFDLSMETQSVNFFGRPHEVNFLEGAEWIQKR